MTNWKDFKNWLDKEIIIHDGLKVKIKPEKQTVYGELSEIVLTNFVDSLEATLDKNDDYHLFSDFDKEQDFDELFSRRVIFGKKTNQKEIENSDCELLERLFSEWKKEEKTKEWEKFHSELALIVYPGALFTFDGYNSNDIILEKIRELVKKIPELESKLKDLNLKMKNNKAGVDKKSTKNLYEKKNNEILQLKRRLELLEESRDEMVNNREEKIEELENQLENKQGEVKWLQDQLKKVLGIERYQSQIEIDYPLKFKSLNIESKFGSGRVEEGEKIINQISGEVSSKHNNFHFYPQQGQQIRNSSEEFLSSSSPAGGSSQISPNQEIRWDLILDIGHNKNDWEIRERVAVIYNFYGGVKKEENVLIRKTARLGNQDYNPTTRELKSQPGKVYRVDYFNEKEQAEINAIFAVSTSTNQPIRWELVNKIKQHINEFKIEWVLALNEGGGYSKEEWIIHNSAERKDNGKGGLIFDSDKMIKVKDLSQEEQKTIGYNKSEVGLKSTSTIQKNNNKGLGAAGIFIIIGVVSILTIGSAVVTKKQLNKKVKR